MDKESTLGYCSHCGRSRELICGICEQCRQDEAMRQQRTKEKLRSQKLIKKVRRHHEVMKICTDDA